MASLNERKKEIDVTVTYTWNTNQMPNTTSPQFSDDKNKYKFTLKMLDGNLYLSSLNKSELFITYTSVIIDYFHSLPLQEKNLTGICASEGKDVLIHQLIGRTQSGGYRHICGDNYEMNTYALHSPIIIICTLIVIKQGSVSNISNELDKMFENMKFCDVILNVQGKEFPAHKFFLTSRSAVFNAMFENQMQERETNQVFIEDVSYDAFREMLRNIYTGNVKNLSGIASEVLGAADKYALEELKKMCEIELGSSLNIQNACEILQLADLHNAHSLKAKAIAFINNNVKDISSLPSWRSFTEQNSRLLNELYLNWAAKKTH